MIFTSTYRVKLNKTSNTKQVQKEDANLIFASSFLFIRNDLARFLSPSPLSIK